MPTQWLLTFSALPEDQSSITSIYPGLVATASSPGTRFWYSLLIMSIFHMQVPKIHIQTNTHTWLTCFLLRGKNKLLFKLQEYWHFKMLYFYLATLSWFSILLDIFKNINIFSPYKYWELLDQYISE